MKKLAFLILPFLLLPSYSLAKSFGDYEGAIYVRNYDGDTITFNLPGLHPIIGEKQWKWQQIYEGGINVGS